MNELEKIGLQKLKEEISDAIKDAGEENTLEFAKNKQSLSSYTKELNDSAKAIVLNEKLSKGNTGTLRELADLQKILAVQFNALTQDEIENSDAGKLIAKQYKEVNDALNQTSQSVGDGRRNVGLYKQSIIEANKEIAGLKKEITQIGFAYGQTSQKLDETTSAMKKMEAEGQTTTEMYMKMEQEVVDLTSTMTFQESAMKGATDELEKQETQLAETKEEARKIGFVYGENTKSVADLSREMKEMQGIMASTDANSEEYIEASIRAGELRDKIKEVKENTNALAGGTGFEKMSNTMGAMKDDLWNLDFEGVSEKAQTLQSISKDTTFKEVTGGLKQMGSALINLGKTILANPLFLMVAVIGAVVGALIYFSDETEEAEKVTKDFDDALKDINDTFSFNAKAVEDYGKITINQMKLRGATDKEVLQQELKNQQDRINAEWNKTNEIIKASNKVLENEYSDIEATKKASEEGYKAWVKQQELKREAKLLGSDFDVKLKGIEDKNREDTKKKNIESANAYKKAQEEKLALPVTFITSGLWMKYSVPSKINLFSNGTER